IFLLSIDEIIKYFTGGMPLVNLGDPDILGWTIDGINPINAVSSGHGATNWWWLRSPGKHAFHGSTVVTEGELIVYVEYVHRHGGVRPAMWVRVID
ncbi:MAG: DUF6273 domain-containing protein, partial [Defluviitaleaceae bacterium]|nr:DUF6273 domain-containing protein [Defluviitaleaceae bacterium]